MPDHPYPVQIAIEILPKFLVVYLIVVGKSEKVIDAFGIVYEVYVDQVRIYNHYN